MWEAASLPADVEDQALWLGATGKGGAFIGGPVGALAPISNLDQFKDRETYTNDAKHLDNCMRLYEESMKFIQPGMEGI
jgi:hypothetical protein